MKIPTPRLLTSTLAAALALGLATPPVADAARKKDDDRKKSSGSSKGKKAVQKRETRRSTPVARRSSSPSRSKARSSSSSSSSSSRRTMAVHRPSSRSKAKPSKKITRAPQRSKAPVRRVVSASSSSRRHDSGRTHRVQKAPVKRSAIASRERSKASPPRRTHHVATQRKSAPKKQIHRTSVVSNRSSRPSRSTTYRAPVRRSSSSDRHVTRNRSHSSHSHKDRSHYRVRHSSHSHDWYRNNGWHYDTGYYQSNRRHRYYNDTLATFIFDTVAPAYISPARSVYDGYGYDLETLYAVQVELANAGYYGGAIDGQIGPASQSAIYNYQQDYQLPATGQVDDYLLSSLGIQ
jgi:hypothetical protein